MITIELKGKNYSGFWDRTRWACRGIIIDDGKLLLSYLSNTDTWMLPGGGMENDETPEQCCRREVAEETGFVISTDECVVEMTEYYESKRYVTYYFAGKITGRTDAVLTEAEQAFGLQPRWLDLDEAIRIFSEHEKYTDEEEKRGLYEREYRALNGYRKAAK